MRDPGLMACSTDPGSSLLLISPPQLPGVLLWAHTHLPNIPDTIAVKDFRPDYTKTAVCKDFPGDPVVETPHCQYTGCWFTPWSGN